MEESLGSKFLKIDWTWDMEKIINAEKLKDEICTKSFAAKGKMKLSDFLDAIEAAPRMEPPEIIHCSECRNYIVKDPRITGYCQRILIICGREVHAQAWHYCSWAERNDTEKRKS